MSLKLETKSIPSQSESPLNKEIIGNLTREGRVPTAWYANHDEKGKPTVAFVLVPPEGVSFGDKIWYMPGGGIEFFYAGKSMGAAEMTQVSPDEAQRVLRERDKILESIGRKNGDLNHIIGDDEAEILKTNS